MYRSNLGVGLDVIFFELVVAARHAHVVWSDEDAPYPGTELPGYPPFMEKNITGKLSA